MEPKIDILVKILQEKKSKEKTSRKKSNLGTLQIPLAVTLM